MLYTVSLIEEVFPGFYNTPYDPSNIERHDDDGNLEEFDDIQFKEFTDRFCEEVVYLIEKYTNFKVRNWELISPSAYNYSNDILWLTIDVTPEKILYEFLNHDEKWELLEYIYLDDWNEDEYHEALLQQMLSYAISDREDELLQMMY